MKTVFSILLVDDDPTVIRILSGLLREYTPLRFATSGHVALKLAREAVPDLVVLDLEMPELSGVDVCNAFKQDPRLESVPIIFISSPDSPHLETVRSQLRDADFISKPPHASLVLSRVRTYQQLKSLSAPVHGAVRLDFLTGTASRPQMVKALAREWQRSHRFRSPLSLLLADIDAFCELNRQLGSDTGDACLRSVAAALRAVAYRPTDLVARHRGGQFVLMLPETSSEGAITMAERALQAIDDLRIVQCGETRGDGYCRLTLSIGGVTNVAAVGFSQGPLHRGAPGDLIAAVESAALKAKAAGGHRAQFVDFTEFTRQPRSLEH